MRRFLLVFIILSISMYFWFSRNTQEEDRISEKDPAQQSVFYEKKKESEHDKARDENGINKKIKTATSDDSAKEELAEQVDEREMSDEELDALDSYFDNVQNQWNSTLSTLFIDEFGLSNEDYEDYLKMRESFEEDKLEAFQKHHEELIKQYGESYQFRPGREMSKHEGRVRKEYADLLKKKIGSEYYERYREVLNDFNENLRLEQTKEMPNFTIEY